MHYPAKRLKRHPGMAAVTQPQFAQIIRVKAEMPAVTPADGADDVHFTEHPVLNFHAGIALQDGIRGVKQHGIKPVCGMQIFVEHFRVLFLIRAGVRWRLNAPWHPLNGKTSLAQLRKKVGVLFFNVSRQIGLGNQIATFSPAKALRRPVRGDTRGGMLNITAGNLRNIQRGTLHLRVKGERFSVKINYASHYQHPRSNS